MKPRITAREHYDHLAEMGNDLNDPPELLEYMSRWDGPPFWKAIGDTTKKDILEIGIGTGRIARQLLNNGCNSLTGLDISPKTIASAETQLIEFSNLRLILGDITEFCSPGSFDVACSVLTFMHIQDKHKALQNIVDSLRPGGRVVLSIDKASDSFDFEKWEVTLYPWTPDKYADALKSSGCEMIELIPLIDNQQGPKKQIATLIKAIKK